MEKLTTNHKLKLRLAPVDGCAVHALWLTERHGFRLETVTITPGSDCQWLNVQVSTRGRSVQSLVDALSALDDVDTITCHPGTPSGVVAATEAIAV